MSLKKRLEDYYRGRADQKEFTDSDLPETRPQLFRAVLSVRKREMVGLNMLCLLIWLPAVVWTVINYVQLNAMAGQASAQQLGDLLFSYLLVLAPLIAIAAPFNAGASYVMCNWARDEHSELRGDFLPAVRENWKQSLAFGAINGAAPLLIYGAGRFYAQLARTQGALFYLPLALLLALGLIWLLMAQLMPALMVNYAFGFGEQLRTALTLVLRALPLCLGVKLLTLAVPALFLALVLLVPQAEALATTIVSLLYALFWLSFNRLIVASLSNALCERELNPHIEGARCRIGLRPLRGEAPQKK